MGVHLLCAGQAHPFARCRVSICKLRRDEDLKTITHRHQMHHFLYPLHNVITSRGYFDVHGLLERGEVGLLTIKHTATVLARIIYSILDEGKTLSLMLDNILNTRGENHHTDLLRVICKGKDVTRLTRWVHSFWWSADGGVAPLLYLRGTFSPQQSSCPPSVRVFFVQNHVG